MNPHSGSTLHALGMMFFGLFFKKKTFAKLNCYSVKAFILNQLTCSQCRVVCIWPGSGYSSESKCWLQVRLRLQLSQNAGYRFGSSLCSSSVTYTVQCVQFWKSSLSFLLSLHIFYFSNFVLNTSNKEILLINVFLSCSSQNKKLDLQYCSGAAAGAVCFFPAPAWQTKKAAPAPQHCLLLYQTIIYSQFKQRWHLVFSTQAFI